MVGALVRRVFGIYEETLGPKVTDWGSVALQCGLSKPGVYQGKLVLWDEHVTDAEVSM